MFSLKDDAEINITGNSATTTKLKTSRKINGVSFDGSADITLPNATTSANGIMSSTDKSKMDNTNVAWGTCSTAAATAAKEITITGNTNWVLKEGSIIGVKFTNTNSASSVTLNVNNTGAKQIAYSNSRPYTGNSNMIAGYANRTLIYMYDGTYWVWISGGYDANDNAVPSAISWTAAATAAKTASQNYYTAMKGYTLVTFQYANTAASALTLNINGKGAKPIYINGTASSATNYTLAAGCYLVYFNGTNYYFRSDGLITGSITGNAATASKLATARTISLTGDVTGSTSFDGSGNVSISCTIDGAGSVSAQATSITCTLPDGL